MTFEQPAPLSRETQFVAACCRWPQNEGARIAVRNAISQITDWEQVEQVCRRHRVVGLVHNALREQPGVPAEFSATIKLGAQKIAVNAARQAQEAVRLETLMRENAIASVQFKGPSLSQIAYGTLGIKRSKDLDILVSAQDVPTALKLLEGSNYSIGRTQAPISAQLSDALIRHRNQIELIDPYGMIIELHWQLANAPGLLPDIERQMSTQTVTLEGYGQITTLADADLFAYLCQHGALHDWARLRWLVDVAALYFSKGDDVIAPLMKAAHSKGAGLAAEQAQLLCHHLFATPAPTAVSARTRQLTDYALHRIEAPYTRERVFEKIGFNARRWWMQRHFYPNSRTALGLLKVHRASLDDIIAMPLPAHLDWLYPILRLPRWAMRRALRPSALPTK
ncbi:nucleotidyltransferase domain-containing protein [Planktotalea sp.]|uniref:nucleotidyltransferase domain-containing protein n=1 Tax=Planktotalea sp. TaxID=2029877 RepID=UPI003D6A071D